MGSSLGDLVKNVVTLGAYGQQKAQKNASDAQQAADIEARRIAASQKPMEETATLLTDTGTNDSLLGSLGLTVDPDLSKKKKPTSLGTTSGSSGIGTSVTGSLGFGG